MAAAFASPKTLSQHADIHLSFLPARCSSQQNACIKAFLSVGGNSTACIKPEAQEEHTLDLFPVQSWVLGIIFSTAKPQRLDAKGSRVSSAAPAGFMPRVTFPDYSSLIPFLVVFNT